MQSGKPSSLGQDLPAPHHDGACDHLRGRWLPTISLQATSGEMIDLSRGASNWTVIYCYPRTSRPGRHPAGDIEAWNAIPGASGCTPQSCAYRDHHAEIKALGATLYGLSTQVTAYQREAVERLHLPFPLLSDASLAFATALQLPTFAFAGQTLIKRLTLIIHDGRIEEVFYPVFPSNADAPRVVSWLTSRAGGGGAMRDG